MRDRQRQHDSGEDMKTRLSFAKFLFIVIALFGTFAIGLVLLAENAMSYVVLLESFVTRHSAEEIRGLVNI